MNCAHRLFVPLVAVLLGSCTPRVTVNSAPVADPGLDFSGLFGNPILLTGSSSVLGSTFAWSLAMVPALSTATIENPDQMVSELHPDFPGVYVVQLIVTAPDGQPSVPAFKNVTLIAAPGTAPTVTIDAPPTIQQNAMLTLKGHAYDPTNTGLTFRWQQAATDYAVAAYSEQDFSPDTIATVTVPPLPGNVTTGTLHFTLFAVNGLGGVGQASVAVTVTSLPPLAITLECPGCQSGPTANEQTAVTVQVVSQTSGAVIGNTIWTAAPLPSDAQYVIGNISSFTEVTPSSATWQTPAVYRNVTINITATASAPGFTSATATLSVQLLRTMAKPPVGNLTLTPRAMPVLPGDAVDATATWTDLGGGTVTSCSLIGPANALIVPSSSNPCVATLFPLTGGNFALTSTAMAEGQMGTAVAILTDVKAWQVESGGSTITAIALDGLGHAIGGDDQANIVIYTGLVRSSMPYKMATFSAAAAAMSGNLGVVGWTADPSLLAIDPKSGTIANTQTTSAVRTFDLEAGGGNLVFGALSGLVVQYDAPDATFASFIVPGAPDVTAVAEGVQPLSNPTGVWYGTGGNLYWQTGLDPLAWTGPGAVVTLGLSPSAPRISAISAGGDGLNNLWVGTSAAADPTQQGSGLAFYASTLGTTGPTAPVGLTTLLTGPTNGGIVHIAAETSGPFNGDVWAVSGTQLVRVSVAPLNASTTPGLTVVNLLPPTGVSKTLWTTVSPGSIREIGVATDIGLALLE
jgi:hypothetical protein